MKIQTLVVTMNQNDRTLPKKMNIQTDALIGNQCGKNEVDTFEYGGNKIQYISTDTRGVGINRNMVFMRAECDFAVLADDDMTFQDGYASKVLKWFNILPDADVLIFNLKCEKARYANTSICRITEWNYGRYGAARLVLRMRSIKLRGIFFNPMFGGGCEFACGEDTLFIRECLKRGLKIYAVPDEIAEIADDRSSWFNGYTDDFFFDKGVLYYLLSRRVCRAMAMYHCYKHRKKYKDYGWRRAYRQMFNGIKFVSRKKVDSQMVL